MNNDSFNGINFKSASHVYFYTPDGKRIISDKNVKKCERYLVRHLNGAKKIETKIYVILLKKVILIIKINQLFALFMNMQKIKHMLLLILLLDVM